MCAQSCPTLCNPKDYSPPGYSVHGIFQARILEWVAISYSRVFKEKECIDWAKMFIREHLMEKSSEILANLILHAPIFL